MTAEKAWAALATMIVVYEITCPDQQLLSHGVDRWRARKPILTTTIIVVTAAHLLRALPRHVDPFQLTHPARHLWQLFVQTA